MLAVHGAVMGKSAHSHLTVSSVCAVLPGCWLQMRDLPQGPPSPAKAIEAALREAESSGQEPAPANPFSAGARSKL